MTQILQIKRGAIIPAALHLIHNKHYKHSTTMQNQRITVYTYTKKNQIIKIITKNEPNKLAN